MLVLGIDTSTSVSSLALYDGKKIISRWDDDNGFTHSKKMMPQLELLLKSNELIKEDITAVAVSTGPGSFTGLRIGVSTAKTMCYALEIPVVGIPTSVSLAWNLPISGVFLVPLIDAQKDNVYYSIYEWEKGILKEIKPIGITSFSDVLFELSHLNKSCILLGDDIDETIELPENVSWALPHIKKTNAASVAMAAYDRLLKNESDDIFSLEPFYVKKSEAEILWEKRQSTLSEK